MECVSALVYLHVDYVVHILRLTSGGKPRKVFRFISIKHWATVLFAQPGVAQAMRVPATRPVVRTGEVANILESKGWAERMHDLSLADERNGGFTVTADGVPLFGDTSTNLKNQICTFPFTTIPVSPLLFFWFPPPIDRAGVTGVVYLSCR